MRSGGQDSTVKVFDVDDGIVLHKLSGLEQGTGCIAFPPPGLGASLIAAGGWNGQLYIWDLAVSGAHSHSMFTPCCGWEGLLTGRPGTR